MWVKSVTLQKGVEICQLEEYENTSPIIEKELNDDEEQDKSVWMNTILNQIPDSVPNYFVDKLKLSWGMSWIGVKEIRRCSRRRLATVLRARP